MNQGWIGFVENRRSVLIEELDVVLSHPSQPVDSEYEVLKCKFVSGLPVRLEKMFNNLAVIEKDRRLPVGQLTKALQEFCRHAHMLYGTAGSYGFYTLSEYALDLERSIKDVSEHPDCQLTEKICRSFRWKLDRIHSEIRKYLD